MCIYVSGFMDDFLHIEARTGFLMNLSINNEWRQSFSLLYKMEARIEIKRGTNYNSRWFSQKFRMSWKKEEGSNSWTVNSSDNKHGNNNVKKTTTSASIASTIWTWTTETSIWSLPLFLWTHFNESTQCQFFFNITFSKYDFT